MSLQTNGHGSYGTSSLGIATNLLQRMPNHDLRAEAVHLLGVEEDSATM
jgi:hypothetical protein